MLSSFSFQSPAKKDDNKINDLFFKDGKRRIDFVLAYRKQESEEREEKRVKKRQNFEANLLEEGLQLEYENSEVMSWFPHFELKF